MQCQWCEFFSGTYVYAITVHLLLLSTFYSRFDFRILLLVKALCSIIMKHTKNIYNTKKKLRDNTQTAILLSGELFNHDSCIAVTYSKTMATATGTIVIEQLSCC